MLFFGADQAELSLFHYHRKHTQLFHYRLCLLYQYWFRSDVNTGLLLWKYMSAKCVAYLQYHKVDDT